VEVIWTKEAIRKLNKIVDHIAKDDYPTAEKWALKLMEKTDRLIGQPESGRIVPEYSDPGLREIIHGNYRIIYRIREEETKVYIQTVWHVRQLPPNTSRGLR